MDEKCIVIDKEFLETKFFSEDEIIREGERWPKYSRTFIVCIDSFEDGVPKGRLHNYYFAGEDTFTGLDQLLFAMEEVMEQAETPIRDAALRRINRINPARKRITQKELNAILISETMFKAQPHYTPDTLYIKRGDVTNFYIYPMYRSHYSLQGIVAEVGKDTKQYKFRSEMELLYLLRDAIIRAKSKEKSRSKD